MTDYNFAGFLAWDSIQQKSVPGAVFTMVNASGSAVTLKSASGSPIASLVADANGVVPPFIAVDASIGNVLSAGNAGLTQPVSSTWAQDPAQVASAVAASATAAATSASQASSTVSSVSTGLNTLAGRVTALEQGGTGGGPGAVPGTQTNITINAANYGNAWPSPVRLTSSSSYAVTFMGSIAAPPAVAVGSDAGMQPGDSYIYTGS